MLKAGVFRDSSSRRQQAGIYRELRSQLTSVLEAELDAIANAANTAALLYHAMPDVHWVGFYFLKGSDLVLGPFQGKPACVRVRLGKVVCDIAGDKNDAGNGPNALHLRIK